MVAATTCHVSCSSAFSDNYGESSINDHSYCEILKTEIQVLHNELKSLTEIINILNNELKMTCAIEDTLTHSKSTVSMKTPLLPCGNCVQLEDKLHKAQEEINSQKLIISLLNEGNNPVNRPHQPQQANLEIDNASNNDCVPTRSPMSKKTNILHNTLNHEQYTIPTSNRYTALYYLPDHISRNSLQTPFQDILSHKNSQRNKNNKLQPKTSVTTDIKGDSSSTTAHHNLQALEPVQEISTIPTIVNGVITKKNQNKCFKSSNITHKIVLSGDSHIKGFAMALQSVMTSECQLFSVVKPGSNSNIIGESITETVKQLSKDDILMISSGSNDYELDNFKLTSKHIKEYLSSITHTNVLVLGIPFRYDL